MTLAAPLPVGAVSLPRVSTEGRATTYSSADGLIALTASHQIGKRFRRVLRLDYSKIAADPFTPANNQKFSMSQYMVFDCPLVGFTNAEVKAVYDAWKGNFTASTDANVTKLIAGES